MIWFYDLETLDIFTGTFLNKDSNEVRQFVISDTRDDRESLFNFLDNEVKGLIGFNCLHFDSQILEYMYRNSQCTPDEIRRYAAIITDDDADRRADVPEWRLRIPHLDLYKVNHFDNKNRRTSLKWCEYMMDMDNIEDLPSQGEGDTWEEIVLSYNMNDVDATKELYNYTKPMIELRKKLSKKYKLNLLNASNTRIGSELLLKLYCQKTGKYARDVRSLRTYRKVINLSECIFPYIKFKSITFQSLLKKLQNKSIRNTSGDLEFSINYKGLTFEYGTGGLHASVSNKIIESDDEYMIIDVDVASLYPSIAVVNKMYPQHLGPEFYEVYKNDIVDVRLAEKAKKELGDKDIINGFKEAANASYGNSNSQFSWLYDPKYTVTTTLNGQLMLTMLAEDLMEISNLFMIQCNTDGLTVKLPRNKLDEFYQKCKDWENTTQLILEYAEYSKMMIRDVNNYIALYTNGKYKCKGCFEFENIPLHKNKSHNITPIAVFNYFSKNIPVKDTILNHRNIFDFCAGVKAKKSPVRGKGWYELHWLEGEDLRVQKLSKTVRYYVSTEGKSLVKKFENGYSEFVEAPIKQGSNKRHVLVQYFNKVVKYDNFEDYKIDYQYYISEATKWINQFHNPEQLTLFN